MTKSIRYGRPCLEVEFDQQALKQPGCCRFVPVVMRLCGIPIAQRVTLTVTFDRIRKYSKEGQPLDDYALHPNRTPVVPNAFPNYQEYAVELLARAHEQEVGTIHIVMCSPSGGILSQAEYRLDSRQAKPVQRECKGFLSTRLLPYIRTSQERGALRGRFAAFDTTPQIQACEVGPENGAHMEPLFREL